MTYCNIISMQIFLFVFLMFIEICGANDECLVYFSNEGGSLVILRVGLSANFAVCRTELGT